MSEDSAGPPSPSRRLLRIVPVADSESPVLEEPNDWTGCQHVTGLSGQAVLHEASRTVTCRDCGETLDPYNVLLAIARHYRQRIEGPLRSLRSANAQYNDNERRKFLNRLERHQRRHPTYVGTCRTCQRLEWDGKPWMPQPLKTTS